MEAAANDVAPPSEKNHSMAWAADMHSALSRLYDLDCYNTVKYYVRIISR
jgi:hypothetical protein